MSSKNNISTIIALFFLSICFFFLSLPSKQEETPNIQISKECSVVGVSNGYWISGELINNGDEIIKINKIIITLHGNKKDDKYKGDYVIENITINDIYTIDESISVYPSVGKLSISSIKCEVEGKTYQLKSKADLKRDKDLKIFSLIISIISFLLAVIISVSKFFDYRRSLIN